MSGNCLSVAVYKGEGRFLVVPEIKCEGLWIQAQWYESFPLSVDCDVLGDCMSEAIKYIKNSKPLTWTSREIEMNAGWKKGSKYKSWISFWKNNLMARVRLYEDGSYIVYSTKRTEDIKGGYYDCIKQISLLANTTACEIGKAIKDVLTAAEEFYLNKKDGCKTKQIQLLNEKVLTVNNIKDVHFEDSGEGSAAEIYQCYSYIPKENAESSAEIFLGIAAELDCNIEPSNVHSVWEELYGKADLFEVQDIEYGIFKLRVEMRNRHTHKISYLLQMEEDLLLECGLDVHQPNRRKKLDDKLVQEFETFVLNCRF